MPLSINPDKVVKVQVPGESEPYSLYFGMGALRKFELESDKSIMSIFSGDSIMLNDLALLLKHGFATMHPNLTSDEVDLIIDSAGMNEVLKMALDALAKAMPKNVQDEAMPSGNPPAPIVELVQSNGEAR